MKSKPQTERTLWFVDEKVFLLLESNTLLSPAILSKIQKINSPPHCSIENKINTTDTECEHLKVY